ncbi:MAG TPA: hypothetical protein DCE80_00670 [Ignavibacteriales bacterium]|nr:hypothetical protein [Ignavibacteriales bacterium]
MKSFSILSCRSVQQPLFKKPESGCRGISLAAKINSFNFSSSPFLFINCSSFSLSFFNLSYFNLSYFNVSSFNLSSFGFSVSSSLSEKRT